MQQDQASGSESDADESGSEDSDSGTGRDRKDVASEDDMEDQEWARFQKKLNKSVYSVKNKQTCF